jgi:GH18 family chitinase
MHTHFGKSRYALFKESQSKNMIVKKVLKVIHKKNTVVVFGFMIGLLTCYAVNAQVKVVGYVSNEQVTSVDYSKITHLNIAFENPDVNGDLSYASANTAYIQKAHDNGKKVLISIAGGFASEDATFKARYFDLISDAKRSGFVQKISDYITNHNFDGLDVDMEGSAINADYGKFIADLSASLKYNNKLLTCALSHVNGGANVPDEALLLFDFVNIMAYDATGPWNPSNPGQHSSYNFAISSLDYWVGRGLPKSKAVLGVPFYGYGFGADFNQGMPYSQIVSKYAGAENRDESGNTIYYNGIPTIQQKVQYVIDGEYGGIMIWNLAQDLITTNPKSLLRTIDNVINNITTSVETDVDEVIEVYPNPTEGILNIKTEPKINSDRMDIIDSTGKRFESKKVKEDVINVSALPSGLYMLCVSQDHQLLYKKFVKR